MHLFALTFHSGAATPVLQRAILANSLVNHRGLENSHFEKDRELEFLNRLIKDVRAFNRTSSLPASFLLKKAALISPQSKLVSSRLATQTNYKNRTLHPEKSSTEDVLALGARLWEGSIAPKRGRDSTFVARDFMNAGLQSLEVNVQRFNDDLSRAAMSANGLVAADTMDPDIGELESEEELDQLGQADAPFYRAQLQLCSDEETTSEGPEIDDGDDADSET
jgi:hypothetical protein